MAKIKKVFSGRTLAKTHAILADNARVLNGQARKGQQKQKGKK